MKVGGKRVTLLTRLRYGRDVSKDLDQRDLNARRGDRTAGNSPDLLRKIGGETTS
jgi:hypothetical protein